MRKALAIALAVLLSGCASTGGNMPTMEQVQLNIPQSVRECPGLPASPGGNASQRQTAAYIVRLVSAIQRCRQNNQAVDKIYRQYQSKIKQLAGTVKRIAAGQKAHTGTKIARAKARKATRYANHQNRKARRTRVASR